MCARTCSRRDITDEQPAEAFSWKRSSGNSAWAEANFGKKEITLSAEEVSQDTEIQCELMGEAGNYGTMSADIALEISYTPKEVDGLHHFMVLIGELFLVVPEEMETAGAWQAGGA